MRSIVVTGSLAFDQIMNMQGRFADHIMPDKLHVLNVSFSVDTLRKEYGGTGGNVAYTLALLGLRPRLVAALGEEDEAYKNRLEALGVDVSLVRIFAGEKTALGTVVTDRDDNQIWSFFLGAFARSHELSLFPRSSFGLELGNKDRDFFVLIGPNDPKAGIKFVRECIKTRVPYMFDPAFQIPHYSKADLRLAVEHAEVIIGNDYEIALMRDKLQATSYKPQATQVWITTLGKKGSLIRQGNLEYRIKAAKVQNPCDPTGAGDAYRAGFLAGYIKVRNLDVCGQMGSVAAAYTVEKYGTQTHKFTRKEFEVRYRNEF